MKLETGIQGSGYYYSTEVTENTVIEIQESAEDGINRTNEMEFSEKRIKAIKERLMMQHNESPHIYRLTA